MDDLIKRLRFCVNLHSQTGYPENAKLFDEAADALERMQWQPIETAPKDGIVILLWWPHWWHDPHPGYWENYQWHFDKALSPCHEDDDNGPTYWMPLPPPKQEDK